MRLNTVIFVGYSRAAELKLNTANSPHASSGSRSLHASPAYTIVVTNDYHTKAQYHSLCGLLTTVSSRAHFRRSYASNFLVFSSC